MDNRANLKQDFRVVMLNGRKGETRSYQKLPFYADKTKKIFYQNVMEEKKNLVWVKF